MPEEHHGRGMDTSNERVNPIEVQSYLKGMHYPTKKQDLVETAQKEGATEPIMNVINQLPEKDFLSAADVTHEVSQAL